MKDTVAEAADTEAEEESAELPNIRQVAIQIQKDEGSDAVGAESQLRKAIEADADLKEALVEWAVHEVLREARRKLNQSIMRIVAPIAISPDDPRGLMEMAKTNITEYYKYNLLHGRVLGDAKPEDLEEMAVEHERNVSANAVKVRWFRLLKKKMGKKKGVLRDHLSEKEIGDLYREAQNG